MSNLNTLPLTDLSLGNLLFQPVTSAAAQAAGIGIPYPNFATQPSITVGQALRPYPQYLNISQEWAPEGIARFNSLQLKVTKRYSSGITLLAFYTWSKEMTNTEGGPIDLGPSDGAQQNPNNRASEVSVSTNGPPSVFVASATYELPFGPGKALLNRTHALSRVVGGWQITAYVLYGWAAPYDNFRQSAIRVRFSKHQGKLCRGRPIWGNRPAELQPGHESLPECSGVCRSLRIPAWQHREGFGLAPWFFG